MSKTATEPTELVLSFQPESDPPEGIVRDSSGRSRRFEGWLGLLRLLETHHQTSASETAPATPREHQ